MVEFQDMFKIFKIFKYLFQLFCNISFILRFNMLLRCSSNQNANSRLLKIHSKWNKRKIIKRNEKLASFLLRSNRHLSFRFRVKFESFSIFLKLFLFVFVGFLESYSLILLGLISLGFVDVRNFYFSTTWMRDFTKNLLTFLDFNSV